MSVTFRPGTFDDNFAAYLVQHHAVTDLVQRLGFYRVEEAPTDAEVRQGWERARSLYEHLTRTAEHFWLAEQEGEVIGYSRACNRDGVRQLTEFFVLPGVQARGVGKELLARAFPRQQARLRLVIASPALGAQVLYMRSGVYARHALYGFSCTPQETALPSDLSIEPAPDVPEALAYMAAVDQVVLGFRRDEDHAWLLTARQGWLYRSQDHIVGYGYTGARTGPFALLDPAHYPAVLAHAEHQAAAAGRDQLTLWVHSTNRDAVDYLLARKYTLNPFVATLLSDSPFGRFEQYVNTDPPFFL